MSHDPIYVQALAWAVLPLFIAAGAYGRRLLGIPPSKRQAIRMLERQQAKRMRDSMVRR